MGYSYEGIASWRLLGLALIIGCLIGWMLFRWLRRGREGFQAAEGAAEPIATDLLPLPATQQCPARDTDANKIKAKFWELVGLLRATAGTTRDDLAEMDPKTDAEKAQKEQLEKAWGIVDVVESVMNPGENATYQVVFPLYISVYALATYGGARADCARVDLFERYNDLLKGLTETVYDQQEVAAWGAQPKEKTCAALQVIEGNFREAKQQLRARVQDISGMTFTLGDLRDENLDFQRKFEESCKNALSDSCKQLASQEPILFPLLAQFEGVAATNYEKEDSMNETLETVGDLYKLLGCKLGTGTTLVYSADKDAGEIDPVTLQAKLQTLSPYYLSPDVLKYITEALISPDDVMDSLMNTSDIFAKVNTQMGTVRRISGLAA